MAAHTSSRRRYVILREISINLVPYVRHLIENRSCFDRPRVKRYSRFRADNTLRPKLPCPNLVVRSNDELRVGKLRLKQFAELFTMLRIYGHHNVVKNSKSEFPFQHSP